MHASTTATTATEFTHGVGTSTTETAATVEEKKEDGWNCQQDDADQVSVQLIGGRGGAAEQSVEEPVRIAMGRGSHCSGGVEGAQDVFGLRNERFDWDGLEANGFVGG